MALEYSRAWAPLIDDGAIQEYTSGVFELHFVKRSQMDERIRLPHDQTAGDMASEELLQKCWQASHIPEEEIEALNELAEEILLEDLVLAEEGVEIREDNTEERTPVPRDMMARQISGGRLKKNLSRSPQKNPKKCLQIFRGLF